MNRFLQRYLKPRDHVSTKSQPVPETARSVGRKKGFRVMEVHQPARRESWVVPQLN